MGSSSGMVDKFWQKVSLVRELRLPFGYRWLHRANK